MAYAAVICVMNALDSLEFAPHIRVHYQTQPLILKVWEGLESLREILKGLDDTSKGSSRKEVNALDAEIKEAVWEFQDLFESHLYDHLLALSESDHFRCIQLNLQDQSHDMNCFVEMLKEKGEDYLTLLDNLDEQEEEEEEESTQTAATVGGGKFEMVGHSLDMLSELIRTRQECSSALVDVVLVFGMAGIGKTAVAREFFDDPELDFDCRAWVTVGRKPSPIHAIKRDILTQLDPASKDHRKKVRERDVEHLLKRIFKEKRCLLVLDDVWDTLVWEELEILFPDYGGGNDLVLITTRLRHLGVEVDQSWSRTSHEVQLLDEDESWDLLRHRVFGEEEEECPPEFTKSGQKIADICDGLPLMIVAVAALLSEAEMTAEFWEEVAEKDANHPIFTAAYDQLYEVLLPSYEYLPQHLKPCFLHMGVFPRFDEMNRTKFWSLWANEGFLDPTMEDCFHVYLRELMDHSVAMVCQMSSSLDGIKTCRLHSTFWHLCRREATDTKFCRVLTTRDEALQELSMKGQRRLSFHNSILLAMKDLIASVEEACASSARSLLSYGPDHPYPVPICFGLKLLKLLDVPFLRFYEFPEQVIQLIFLKYLALTCNTALPPSISRLWDLRYLCIWRYEMIRFSGETPCVPVEVWDMKQLEYMEIQGWNLPNPPFIFRGYYYSLASLLTLVGVGTETCTKEILEGIPYLLKLGIQIQSHPECDDMEQVLDHLSNIHLLLELESLKCIVVNPVLVMGKDIVPPASMFPSSLTKLLLSGMGYSWEYMSIIGSLPNLRVLKLGPYAFRGPEWVVRYGEFRALTYLLIEGTDLVRFEVEDRGLFSLRNFHIGNCYKLKHLVWEPDLSYPIVIEISDCSPATTAFADEMRSRYESHYQMQDRFQISVQSSWE